MNNNILYNKIMHSISKEVKKSLNEVLDFNNASDIFQSSETYYDENDKGVQFRIFSNNIINDDIKQSFANLFNLGDIKLYDINISPSNSADIICRLEYKNINNNEDVLTIDFSENGIIQNIKNNYYTSKLNLNFLEKLYNEYNFTIKNIEYKISNYDKYVTISNRDYNVKFYMSSSNIDTILQIFPNINIDKIVIEYISFENAEIAKQFVNAFKSKGIDVTINKYAKYSIYVNNRSINSDTKNFIYIFYDLMTNNEYNLLINKLSNSNEGKEFLSEFFKNRNINVLKDNKAIDRAKSLSTNVKSVTNKYKAITRAIFAIIFDQLFLPSKTEFDTKSFQYEHGLSSLLYKGIGLGATYEEVKTLFNIITYQIYNDIIKL